MVSAHYGISVDGLVCRFVLDQDTAFHAGNADVNAVSLGIELEGHADDKDAFTVRCSMPARSSATSFAPPTDLPRPQAHHRSFARFPTLGTRRSSAERDTTATPALLPVGRSAQPDRSTPHGGRMSTHRRRLNWEAFLLSAGAGLAALQIQPLTASWKTYLIAFGAAALPVLALHLRHRQSQKAAAEPVK
jgi:hypothetical protein